MFKRILKIKLMVVLLAVTTAVAQSGEAPPPEVLSSQDGRQNVVRELGLSRDQLSQIRAIRQNQRQRMENAQQMLRTANRNLDEAIYSDSATEETINARIAEVQAAQSEVLRTRSMTEFQIRRVLNSEQLRRFREARRSFAEGRGPVGPRPQGPRRVPRRGAPSNMRPDDRPSPKPKRLPEADIPPALP